MGTASAAVASRPTVGRVEVVGRPDAPVPRWASEWCDQTGFELARRPATGEGDGWSRLLAHVAESTAAGGAVLVSRPSAGGLLDDVLCAARVVAAVQDLPDDTSVVVEAAACAAALRGTLLLVHGVPVSFGERSIGLDAAVSRGRAVLAAAVSVVAGEWTGGAASTRLLRARPHELVNEELEADLLVVGGPRLGQSGGLGLVALSAIQHAPCPVLVAPRTP